MKWFFLALGVALTFAAKTGVKDDDIVLAPEGRGQMAVGRGADGKITTRFVHAEGDGWVLDVRPEGGRFARSTEPAADPTEQGTFQELLRNGGPFARLAERQIA